MKLKPLYGAVTLLLCSLTGGLFAQSQEQIDKFNEERRAYFTKELELTDSECKAFFPLYEDFQNRKMKLVEDERNTWSYAYNNAENLSEEEIQETLVKAYSLKEQQLQLEKEYYQEKFLKALPAKKVLSLGKVEFDFRRYLLHKLRDERKESGSQGGRAPRRSESPEPVPMIPGPYPF
jgi:hypothetical protein